VARAKRSRTEKREAARAADKLALQREKLARLEPGGAPDRPIDVKTASVIEPHASALDCVRCGEGGARVDSHEAREVDGRRLRIVRTLCPRCGTGRVLYFRIVESN
jgi:ribosomal protein S27AE